MFLEGGDREPRQQEFVRSIEDYVDGHWRKSFRTPEELEGLVEQTLREGRPMVAAGSAEGGSRERIGAAFAQRPDRVEGIVWAQVAWTTPRDEEVVDPTDFVNTDFQRDIQRLAHEGDTSLFDYGQAKDTRVEASRLRKIVRQDLRNPDSEIKRTLDMMQLRFREWEGRAF